MFNSIIHLCSISRPVRQPFSVLLWEPVQTGLTGWTGWDNYKFIRRLQSAAVSQCVWCVVWVCRWAVPPLIIICVDKLSHTQATPLEPSCFVPHSFTCTPRNTPWATLFHTLLMHTAWTILFCTLLLTWNTQHYSLDWACVVACFAYEASYTYWCRPNLARRSSPKCLSKCVCVCFELLLIEFLHGWWCCS